MAATNSERWRQIEQIFHAALAVDPGQRPALIRTACQGDEEFQREVASLLSAAEMPALVDRSLWQGGATDRLSDGSQFGCYRIEGFIGEGGMGGVYRARDLNLGREVAFKVLAGAVARDPGSLRRLARTI